MSTYATALAGAGSTVPPGLVGGGSLAASLKGRLVRFFRRLPEHFEHVDPIDYRHPPVPY